ncbi:MAG TPA: hypothetical protein VK498_15965 [Ferruginibacter sp.]|nr:hypothetical protein [Ferruginibacter sp.]
MKNVIFIATLLSCAQVSATEPPIKKSTTISQQQFTGSFSFFRGHRQGKNITLTWGMSSNAGIDQFVVECTYEDPTDPYSVWSTKGVVANTNLRSFKFEDVTDVYPGTMYYRIIAMSGNAPSVVSQIESIRIVSH